ncbi:MAG TPA: hypothetical protein VGG45_17820 [Terracidiphilus sp.]|jgi:hypothetical protein
MAATKSQGQSLTLFLAGLTAVCAGIAYSDTGVGVVALIVGAVMLIASFVAFLKIKPLEGRTAQGPQPTVLKLVGVGTALLGWLVVLFGLHVTASVGGRMFTSILGIAISLVGVCYLLPVASTKGAIWKS